MDEQPRSPVWEIRIAESRENRDRVFRFRYESYIAEFGRWPAAGMRDRKILREVADEGATLLFAEWERRVAGTLRLGIGPIAPDLRSGLQASRFRKIPSEEIAVADQIIIARALRRTTLFVDLLRTAESEAAMGGATTLFCHASDDRAHFYTAIGFQFYGPAFSVLEQGTRYPLVKAIGGPASEERLTAILAESAVAGRDSLSARRR